MAKENLKDLEKAQQELVDEKISSVEKFFNENKKTIVGILVAIVAVGLAILIYNKFYVEPKTEEALQQMFPAEAQFDAQAYDVALNGDGNIMGFAEIAKEYGNKAGKAVYLYAGVCELQLGNYESALGYLKKYSGKDAILAAKALGCMGDAYVGLGDNAKALSCYDKAAAKADNMFAASYLFKAGVVCEEEGNAQKALGYYKRIREEYPQSLEGYDIEKYISKIENAE